MKASNQFALPAMSYFMWTQHWPITELRQVDRDARKIVTEGGGKHPCGTTSLLYLPRDKGGGGLSSVETEYKKTKVKAAVKLYQNRDPAMKMVREFEEQAESKGYQSMTKEAGKYAEEYDLQLQLKHPDPVCVTEEGEVVPGDKLKSCLRKLRESRMEGVVEEQKWQGKLTQASPNSDPTCRLCGTAPESMAHILSACLALVQTKYLARHDAVLKVLFFDIMEDLGLIEASPPWYSPTKPQPVYEGAYAQAYWDVPVFGEYQDLRANRIDAMIVKHQEKKVITMEMSCPWVSNRQKKTSEKTMKYAPLRWELKQKYPGYEISQYNFIVDVLGGWSTDVKVAVKELVGRRHKDVLKNMQGACLSATLNIARTAKNVLRKIRHFLSYRASVCLLLWNFEHLAILV